MCCSPWGHKESDTTEQLNNNNKGRREGLVLTMAPFMAVNFPLAKTHLRGFPGGSVVKNPLASAGGAGSILSQEEPLETEMVTHSSIFAWKILTWQATIHGVTKSQI